jgi:ABC-2 type transport system ATP-binding protein
MPNPVLSLQNINLTLNKKKILENINLSISENEIHGIVGKSGSGKSMLLNTIAGLYPPSQGTITLKNKKANENKAYLKTILGLTPQESSIYENLTIKENLEYFGKLYGLSSKEIKKRSNNLLTLLELTEYANTLVKRISGGTKKRANIACSLIHNPKILLMDEPLSGLDPILRENMLTTIKKIRDNGTTVVVASHFVNEIESNCDRISIIHNGKIIDSGTPAELKQKYSDFFIISLKTSPGNYKKLATQIKKLNPKNIIINDEELIIYVPLKYAINPYFQKLTKLLAQTREALLTINISLPPLEIILKEVLKNA